MHLFCPSLLLVSSDVSGYESFLSDKTAEHSDMIKGTLCMLHNKVKACYPSEHFLRKVSQPAVYSDGIKNYFF